MYSLRWLRDPAPIFSGTMEEIKTFLDKWFERDVGPVEIGYGGVGDYYTWIIADDNMKMKLWDRPDNYMGENYYDYFVLIGHTRDSDALEESNFHTAIDMMGGESETVIVVRSTHWLVGWMEGIFIHKSDQAAINKAEAILQMLEDYPVLDEDDYGRTRVDMGEEEEFEE